MGLTWTIKHHWAKRGTRLRAPEAPEVLVMYIIKLVIKICICEFFSIGCLDVDIFLHISCFCDIKNMFKVLWENVSRDQINFNWSGPHPFLVGTMTLFLKFHPYHFSFKIPDVTERLRQDSVGRTWASNLVFTIWAVFGGFILHFLLSNYLTVLLRPRYEEPVETAADLIKRDITPIIHPWLMGLHALL